MQSQRIEESSNLPLEYCSLLIDLGIPQILSTQKGIYRETPEVQEFFFRLGSFHVRKRLRNLYNTRMTLKKCSRQNGEMRFLNRFLQGIDLKAKVVKKASSAAKGRIFDEYRIVSKTTENVEDIREIINIGDKDKILSLFLKRYNPQNIAFGKKSGVYKILCVPTGDSYIGSSGRLPTRLSTHKTYLKSDKRNHHSQKLQELWNTHGKDNFDFSVIEYTSDYKQREKDFIKEQKPSLNTLHLPDVQQFCWLQVLPEIKEQLMSLSNDLEIDINDLVHQLLTNGLKDFER